MSLHLGRTPADRGIVTEGPRVEEEAEAPAVSEKASVLTPSLLNAPSDVMEQVNAICGRIRAACQDFGIKVTEIDPGQGYKYYARGFGLILEDKHLDAQLRVPEFSQQLVSVTAVPIPASLPLLGSALLGVAGLRRRNQVQVREQLVLNHRLFDLSAAFDHIHKVVHDPIF